MGVSEVVRTSPTAGFPFTTGATSLEKFFVTSSLEGEVELTVK
jgi:hypothetical protein